MPTPEIVSLAAAKAYLRIDHEDEDSVIQSIVDAANEAAVDFADGWDSEDDPPARLKLAVLGHIASAYDARDKVDMPAASQGLARPLRSLDT